ncbi:hypothetical protein DEO72_LG8g2343 [Vigna unguiculata]|uniref:Uncharacterized protein n=1 Tax=Vigna unguiculata TaxID=3917 RepID=A0A4D6MWP6_VIGUN|nr:hypothetical protein DEO72_LG8g2343 [Vigna unguiculata]
MASVAGVSVHVVVCTDGPVRFPPQYQADEFGSLETLRMLIRIRNSTLHYGVLFVASFPACALSVVVGRCGNKTP